jgi:hypothetical protein
MRCALIFSLPRAVIEEVAHNSASAAMCVLSTKTSSMRILKNLREVRIEDGDSGVRQVCSRLESVGQWGKAKLCGVGGNCGDGANVGESGILRS